MNTVQWVPVKYNTFVVYNKDRGVSKGSYLQMGLIKRLRPKKYIYIYIYIHIYIPVFGMWPHTQESEGSQNPSNLQAPAETKHTNLPWILALPL